MGFRNRFACALLVASVVPLLLLSCGGGGSGQPSLTCVADCYAYEWNFNTGSGSNYEWCEPGVPRPGAPSASCESTSTNTTGDPVCTKSNGVTTCSGTFTDDTTGQTYTATSRTDHNKCTLTVTVEGVGTCTSP